MDVGIGLLFGVEDVLIARHLADLGRQADGRQEICFGHDEAIDEHDALCVGSHTFQFRLMLQLLRRQLGCLASLRHCRQ